VDEGDLASFEGVLYLSGRVEHPQVAFQRPARNAQTAANDVAESASLVTAAPLLGDLPCHLDQPPVATHLVQTVQVSPGEVILDQPLLDGKVSLSGRFVVDPHVDLLPPELHCCTSSLMPTHNGAIGQDFQGVLLTAVLHVLRQVA